MYQRQAIPEFSHGWLAAFQSRESVRAWQQFGEDGSTPESVNKPIILIQRALQAYYLKDVFNLMKLHYIGDRSLIEAL